MPTQSKSGMMLTLTACLLIAGGTPRPACATALTTLHVFNSTPPYTDGAQPHSGLVLGRDGNFYGTTFYGGASDTGTIFKITPAGTVTTLYSFSAVNQAQACSNADGAYPIAALIQASDGNLYGTTDGGGAYGQGTIFKITAGGTLTVLHSFTGTDGNFPVAPLLPASDGSFYGVTGGGGAYGAATGGYGTVFKITPDGTFTSLYSFTNGSDGSDPLGVLAQGSDGNFYGATSGGGAYNYGTVFRITPGGSLTILHTFTALSGFPYYANADGASPYAGLVLGNDGAFYGTTTQGGGFGYGTVFRISSEGTLTTLHDFTGAGSVASSGATLFLGSDGNFYGTAAQGGTHNSGTVFKITPGGRLTTLQSLPTEQPIVGYQASLVQGANGGLYGTTQTAGGGSGTVFRVTVNPWDFLADGQTDMLFQNASTGQLAVWSLNAATVTNAAYLTPVQNPNWKAVGVGDFNGDGQPDILFQNPATGQMAVWYMNGAQAVGAAFITPGQDPHWQIVSVADFNGDDQPDVLFQNVTTGQMAVWYMNGTQFSSGSYVHPSPSAGLKVVGTGDFNGDGQPDIALVNPSTGQLTVWFMNGSYQMGSVTITPNQNTAWQPVAVADLNEDGNPDLVFMNPSTGQLAVWFMNGTTVAGAGYLSATQALNWKAVGPR